MEKLSANDIKRIAGKHWEWIEKLIKTFDTNPTMETMEYLFKTGMEHGWKHAKEIESVSDQGVMYYLPYCSCGWKSSPGACIRADNVLTGPFYCPDCKAELPKGEI